MGADDELYDAKVKVLGEQILVFCAGSIAGEGAFCCKLARSAATKSKT